MLKFQSAWCKEVSSSFCWESQCRDDPEAAGNTMAVPHKAADFVQGARNTQLSTVYINQCLFQFAFASTYFQMFFFLPSNFYYTSIISIRTKSDRIHLNKTNFAAIIEKTREMLFFQDTTVWHTTDFQWFRQSQNTRYSTSSNRYNMYREKFPKNVFIFYRFFFLVSPFTPRLNCTFNIKTKNVQTENILTKHPVCRSLRFFFSLAFVLFFFFYVFSAIERTAQNTNLIDSTEVGEKLTFLDMIKTPHWVKSCVILEILASGFPVIWHCGEY